MKRACDAWASQAGGALARGAGAAGAGAGAGAGARAGAGGAGAGARARASLPLLAAYCAAHTDKIRQRDALHATYVSGSNAAGELHNRLEQASEALRSELSDWIPKTRAEIKSLLLEIAERQVSVHKQTMMGWENALKLATESNNMRELFKTVSKNAVQNLSPSKYNATPTETERDFDDISNTSDLSKENDFEVSNLKLDADSKRSDSPENYEVVKGNRGMFKSDECRRNGSTESYEVVGSGGEVAKGNYETVDGNCGTLTTDRRKNNGSTGSYELVGNRDGLFERTDEVDDGNCEADDGNREVVKGNGEVVSDPLRDFAEVDLSS